MKLRIDLLTLFSKEMQVDYWFGSTFTDNFFSLGFIQMCLYGIMTKDVHHFRYLIAGKELFAQ